MISYKSIKLAVNSILKSNFKIEINSNDVKEGFLRPSFFVMLDDSTRKATEAQVHKSTGIRILYFPKEKENNSIELMDMQDSLEELFELKLKVEDRYFNIDEGSSSITDGVLSLSFSIEFEEAKDEKTYLTHKLEPILDAEGNPISIEIMQDLDLKMKG